MALRAELVGPYCLISVTSSVCADQMKSFTGWNLDGANVSAGIDCGCPQVWLQQCSLLDQRVIGQQLTAESELARTPGIRLSN